MQAEAEGGGFRDEARRLLRVSYERQVAGGGQVTHVDLGAGAEELGMDADGHRFSALLDYVEVMGWAEKDLFANDASATHDGAVEQLRRVARSILFQLDLVLEMPLALKRHLVGKGLP